MSNKVSIIEVGPRDGLQNESLFIPTALKIGFIEALLQSGLTQVEVTSFVPAKWVPQMADHEAVWAAVANRSAANLSVLIPNMHGYQRALQLGSHSMAFITAASESFCQNNTACGLLESISRVRVLLDRAQQDGVKNRVYLSCVFNCPYEGRIKTDTVVDLVQQLYAAGATQISLGDTTGKATVDDTSELLQRLTKVVPVESLAVHFHNTAGNALANIAVALQYGITNIDSSAAGLGGCPYSPGASGNVATESVIELVESLGFDSGVDVQLLRAAVQPVTDYLQQHSKAE